MELKEQAKTPLVIVTGLLIIFLFTENFLFAQVAVFIGLIGVFSDFLTRWLILGWMKLAEGLGWVTSKVILTSLFFVFLLPLAIAKRIFDKDGLNLKRTKKDTLFETRNHRYSGEDLENTF